MGRTPCSSKVGLHRGPWTAREDKLLINYIQSNGEGHWRSLPNKAGLLRCGKSCRLRWVNYLRPDIKRGNITPDEDDLIIRLHSLLGNRWSLIAGRLPGRTDNEIKNYWNSHLSKRLKNTSPTSQSRNHDKKIKIKKGNNNNNNNNQESEINNKRIKIHLPKAVRVKRTSSFNNNSMASGSSSGPFQNYYVPITNHDDHNHMLDEIFKEYEQLLKTDNNISQLYSIDSLLS